jgi:hypothetical protein
MYVKKLTVLLFLYQTILLSSIYPPSFPYITGDTFRALADYVLDIAADFDPKTVSKNSTIFVEYSFLQDFFSSYHPHIKAKYVLITHNDERPVPENHAPYLYDPKLLAWFGQNMTSNHPKAICIPLGLANREWPHGKVEMYEQIINNAMQHRYAKNKLLYMNFSVQNNVQERKPAWDQFCNQPFCVAEKPTKPFHYFLENIASSVFVISPPGGGYDCHRTWESLYVGSIPIIKKTLINSVFKDLPVIEVSDWHTVTESFLFEQYSIFVSSDYNYEKLYMPYWIEKIQYYLHNT